MNSKKYMARLEKADELIEESMKFWKVPGAAIAIVSKDEVLLSKGYGFRDVAKKLPVTPKSVFPLASITKSFTAMGVALLVDEGKLSWDDKVQKHLPWFRLKTSMQE
jgi:CubicO group peptidase (beta-lactamase class C family)